MKCFRCWGVGHYKWKCPNIVAEKERRRREKYKGTIPNSTPDALVVVY